jgi:hypothetical protein
MLIEPRPSHRN